MCVVEMALFFIAKNFIGLSDGLELGLGFRSCVFRSLIGVMLQGELQRDLSDKQPNENNDSQRSCTYFSVGLLDIIWAGGLVHTKELLKKI